MGNKASLLLSHAAENAFNLFSLSQEPIETIQRFSIIFMILVWIVVAIIYALREKRGVDSRHSLSAFQTAMICVLTMLSSIILVVFAYDVFSWRDYRTWAPVFWSLLFFCAFSQKPKPKSKPGPLVVSALACTVLVTAVSLPFLSESNVPKPIEWSRYVPVALDRGNPVASLVQPEGIYPEDRTIVLDSWAMTSPFRVTDLDPSIGILLATENVDINGSGIAYMFSATENELLDNYDLIWSGEEGYLYKAK